MSKRPGKKSTRANSAPQVKSARKSRQIENAARKEGVTVSNRLKAIQDTIRVEKKYRNALEYHRIIRKRTKTDIGKAKVLQQYGFYTPKGKVGKSLTADQRKRVKRLWSQNEDYLEPGYIFVKNNARGSKAKNLVAKRAKQTGIKTTKVGMFVKRDANTVSAKLTKFKATDYAIETNREWYDKRGKKHRERIVQPLASTDELDAKKEQIRRHFQKLAGKLDPDNDEFIRFYIEGVYGSFDVFDGDEFDKMWETLEQYRSTNHELFGLLLSMKLGISTPDDPRNKVETEADIEFAERVKERMRGRRKRKANKYNRAKGRG